MGLFKKKEIPDRPPTAPPRPVRPAPPPGPPSHGERTLCLEERRVKALESIAASFARYVDGQFA